MPTVNALHPQDKGLDEHSGIFPLGSWGPAGDVVAQSHCAGPWSESGKSPAVASAALSTDPSALQAVVGDSELHNFHYRIQPEHVRAVEVGGDLQLESLKIF